MGKGYTVTARLDGTYRWAKVPGIRSAESAVECAQEIIADRIAYWQDANPQMAELWTKGAITVTNPQGRIVWSRPIPTLKTGAERYFDERLEDDGYAEAYQNAKRKLEARNGNLRAGPG